MIPMVIGTKILTGLGRVDGEGVAYVLHDPEVLPHEKLARSLYTTPGEAFPGAAAARAWIVCVMWVVPTSTRTTREAMAHVGILTPKAALTFGASP